MTLDPRLLSALAAAAAVPAAWTDARRRVIPNALSLPALALGAAAAVAEGRVVFFLAVLAAVQIAWAMGGMGGGDAKLLAALAGLYPPAFGMALAAAAAVFLVRRVLGRSGPIPGAVPAAAGALLAAALTWAGATPIIGGERGFLIP